METRESRTAPTEAREGWIARYREVREKSESLARPLRAEDQQVQSMPDVSPTKWHLAHVTWFFETFVLNPGRSGYRPFDPDYEYLFNSYYQTVGPQYPRVERGLLSRPALEQVHAYRRHVDRAMERFLAEASDDAWRRRIALVELGLHHEQQHQELMLMDIKHVFSRNPLDPAYHDIGDAAPGEDTALGWCAFEDDSAEIGHDGDGFAFDNESPRHKVLLDGYRLASRPVTNAEYAEFILDGGYDDPRHWLADGWSTVTAEGWRAPLYWRDDDGAWSEFTLSGRRPLARHAPVCHVSYYEADAYARWAGKRLPGEAEWEAVADGVVPDPVEDGANMMARGHFHPEPALPDTDGRPAQLVGDVWEWTQSAYAPYPGFRPAPGAVGEYNGKFMVNQMVLRGGGCATPAGHIRTTYRNFFYPHQRWMFSGIRLADDLH